MFCENLKRKIQQQRNTFSVKSFCIEWNRNSSLSSGFCLERFPLSLGAWDGLRYFIVALPEPSI